MKTKMQEFLELMYDYRELVIPVCGNSSKAIEKEKEIINFVRKHLKEHY
jgi:hypothetical protein